jgi:hypothetical protein
MQRERGERIMHDTDDDEMEMLFISCTNGKNAPSPSDLQWLDITVKWNTKPGQLIPSGHQVDHIFTDVAARVYSVEDHGITVWFPLTPYNYDDIGESDSPFDPRREGITIVAITTRGPANQSIEEMMAERYLDSLLEVRPDPVKYDPTGLVGIAFSSLSTSSSGIAKGAFNRYQDAAKRSKTFAADSSSTVQNTISLHTRELNESQKQVVQHVFRPLVTIEESDPVTMLTQTWQKNALTAFCGPPGTGKTRVFTAIIRIWSDMNPQKGGEYMYVLAKDNATVLTIARALKEQDVDWSLLKSFRLSAFESGVYSEFDDCNVIGVKERGDNIKQPDKIILMTNGVFLRLKPAFLQSAPPSFIIVDEATKLSTADVGPLLRVAAANTNVLTRICLGGDPQQLSPFMSDTEKAITSCLTQALKIGDESLRLTTTYRLPALLAKVLGDARYDGTLVAHQREERACVRFVTTAESKVQLQGTSSYDECQTDMVVNLFTFLIARGFQAKDVAVICLYEAQRRSIAQGFYSATKSPEIWTVDGAQGEEAKIVFIVTTVAQCKRNRFINDPQRLTVAFSRSSVFTFVICNRPFLEDISSSSLFHTILQGCREEGLSAKQDEYAPSHVLTSRDGMVIEAQDLGSLPVERGYHDSLPLWP